MSYSTIACNGGGDLKPELIPGTERIKPNDYIWFTVSPDEKYLAFMEVDSSDWDMTSRPNATQHFHLVTLNLDDGSKTHHHLRDLPSGTFPSGGSLSDWDWVFMNLEPSSWWEGRLYIDIRSGRPWSYTIAFTPGVPAAERDEPEGVLSCSDCPPPGDWKHFTSTRGLPSNPGGGRVFHAAFRNGLFSDDVYREERSGGNDAIIVRDRGMGNVETVVRKKRSFMSMNIDNIRVSPDELYLAYEVTTGLATAIPLPTRDALFVKDLRTGRERSIVGTLMASGNMIWSATSTRFYFAAVDGAIGDGRGDGIYRVTLP